MQNQSENQLEKRIVLGSRSPRRRELLQHLVPASQILILPPSSSEEPGFDGLSTWEEIERQLLHIARLKSEDIQTQLHERHEDNIAALLTADTVIVGETTTGESIVLGQPPDNDEWKDVVRDWFQSYYFGKSHRAVTGLCLREPSGQVLTRVVQSEVTFHNDMSHLLDWYLDTDEPHGKAGGYAIQGAGSLFVKEVRGSLSNVVGLPLKELRELLESIHFYDAA